MSDMLNVCMGEMIKLKQKVQVHRTQVSSEVSRQQESRTAAFCNLKSSVEDKKDVNSLSESTIFLIMDRFAPS
ncbi:hypothetical protein DCAR_0101538 [Daucus carota subsp. sativus]|nr:hypothetical protein DCAR_0101538 [Daucus carota subsp. sativus]